MTSSLVISASLGNIATLAVLPPAGTSNHFPSPSSSSSESSIICFCFCSSRLTSRSLCFLSFNSFFFLSFSIILILRIIHHLLLFLFLASDLTLPLLLVLQLFLLSFLLRVLRLLQEHLPGVDCGGGQLFITAGAGFIRTEPFIRIVIIDILHLLLGWFQLLLLTPGSG